MNKIYTCYKITNTVNGKIYIGQTTKTVCVRWKQHVGTATWRMKDSTNLKAIHRAIRKYGAEQFIIEALVVTDNPLDISRIEQEQIALHDSLITNNRGYNMTAGGGGTIGYAFTEADRLKMSQAQLGHKRGPRTEADKQKISTAKRSNGDKPSEWCKQRRKEACSGIPRSSEVKDRIRQTLSGRPRPPEVIAKIKATKALKKAARALMKESASD